MYGFQRAADKYLPQCKQLNASTHVAKRNERHASVK